MRTYVVHANICAVFTIYDAIFLSYHSPCPLSRARCLARALSRPYVRACSRAHVRTVCYIQFQRHRPLRLRLNSTTASWTRTNSTGMCVMYQRVCVCARARVNILTCIQTYTHSPNPSPRRGGGGEKTGQTGSSTFENRDSRSKPLPYSEGQPNVQGGSGQGTADYHTDTQASTTPRGHPPKKAALAKEEGGRGQKGGRVSGGGRVSLSTGQKKVYPVPQKGVSLAWWLYSQIRRQKGRAAPVSPSARKSPSGVDIR
jgi:hypothetical protein